MTMLKIPSQYMPKPIDEPGVILSEIISRDTRAKITIEDSLGNRLYLNLTSLEMTLSDDLYQEATIEGYITGYEITSNP